LDLEALAARCIKEPVLARSLLFEGIRILKNVLADAMPDLRHKRGRQGVGIERNVRVLRDC
jgi:hypothetical protein